MSATRPRILNEERLGFPPSLLGGEAEGKEFFLTVPYYFTSTGATERKATPSQEALISVCVGGSVVLAKEVFLRPSQYQVDMFFLPASAPAVCTMSEGWGSVELLGAAPLWEYSLAEASTGILSPFLFLTIPGLLRSKPSQYATKKSELVDLIRTFVRERFSWYADEGSIVESEAAETAIRFLNLLPPDRELPSIAPDGEGGLLLVWDRKKPALIVTVEPNKLHAVVAPATADARHFNDLPFERGVLQSVVLERVPQLTQ